jgi:hypothetical protein
VFVVEVFAPALVDACNWDGCRLVKLPSIGSPRCGTGEVYSKVAREISDEGLQERADLKNLRSLFFICVTLTHFKHLCDPRSEFCVICVLAREC